MINNISNVDTSLQPQIGIAKAAQSFATMPMPPVLSFGKKVKTKEKATLRVKKIRRSENILITGNIDDDYVDIIEEELEQNSSEGSYNFFTSPPQKRKIKLLKNCYVIDYIQAQHQGRGAGTEAIKNLVEKAMFDEVAQGRIVTFSAPICKESSPAQFFYKLGFRFMLQSANEYIEECLAKKIPDIPPQTGMMYLPKAHINKLLRYGESF